MTAATQHVVCVGDSVLDVLVHVEPSFLEEHGLEPGGCVAISNEDLVPLLSAASAIATPQRRANDQPWDCRASI